MLWYTKPTSAFCVFKGDHPSQLQVEGLLPSIKSLRGGATAIDRVLGIATGWALSEAQRQLNGGAPVGPRSLSGSNGRKRSAISSQDGRNRHNSTWIWENFGKQLVLRVNIEV